MANDLVVIASKIIKDDKTEGAISVWSTRYGTEQIRYPFPLMSEKDALKKEANILNLACFHNYIVLALSTSTLVCSYQLQTPSLAGVIGKLKLPRNTMISTSQLLEPPLLVPTKLRRPKEDGKFEKKIADSNNEEKRVMERLSDPLKTPTLEDFSKELDRYLQKVQLRATKGTRHDDHGNDNKGDDVETPKKKRRKTSETKHERSIVVPEHITEAVLLRCLSDKRIWSTDIISKIIKTNCVPSRLCPELLEKLLEHDLLALMQDCFRNIKGISEKCVALCVKHLMRLEEEKTQLKNSDQQSEKNSTRTEKISQKTDYTLELLSDIIKYPCDELSLQDALKDLTLAETKLLLQALHLLLLQNPQSPGTERIDLSYEKIIDWTSMVVSAHFTSLILSKEMVKLIRGIQNTVQGQLRLCKNLRSLEPYLRHFKNRYRLPDVEKVGVYTIETLKL